jgi:hypothetical protein
MLKFKCECCSYLSTKKYNINRHKLSKHLNTISNTNNNTNSNNNNNNNEYIYLVQEREFIKTNEPIYKLGKTKQECLKRICNYPNGTKLLIQIICNDCDKYERELINKFKEIFIQKKEIGYEYFKGDKYKMIEIIYNLIWENNIKINNENNDDKKCNKCNKILSSKYYLKKHLLKCKGVSNPLECHICHKILYDSSSKSNHLKICREKSHEQLEAIETINNTQI